MSGGFISEQGQFDHQVVIFTFIGELTPDDVSKWNDAIAELKRAFGAKLVGVTMTGQPTPVERRR
jgi:hypothetical protein